MAAVLLFTPPGAFILSNLDVATPKLAISVAVLVMVCLLAMHLRSVTLIVLALAAMETLMIILIA